MKSYDKFNIRKFVQKYGALFDRQQVPGSVCSRYQGRLPDDVIGFWRENGIGTWLGGKFQFCIPLDFDNVVAILFEGDPDIDPARSHVVGYSAFGELLLWNQDLQTCKIDLWFPC